VVALIGAFSTIVTALISNRTRTSKEDGLGKQSKMSNPTIAIVNLGVALTTLAVVISLLIFQLSRVEKGLESLEIALLDNFLDTPIIPEIERLKKLMLTQRPFFLGLGQWIHG